MLYQLGWSTLPGLRGLACSDFRATPTSQPEAHFAAQCFTNAADAFDTVKAFALEAAQ